MIILKTAAALQQFLQSFPGHPHQTGFVPTMGALHKGHLSLVKKCREERAITVASIFVNPTQFNDLADFERYPVTLEKDTALLADAKCDVLFLPSLAEVYPDGTGNLPEYDLGEIGDILEGFYRPGHFSGVCQVVHRLLSMVRPGHLYLGQKDYQQCKVIERLVNLTEISLQLHIVPTVREHDGLAMSSRNMRLSPAERKIAPAIYEELCRVKANLGAEPVSSLTKHAVENLLRAGFSKVDYIAVAERDTLAGVDQPAPGQELVVLMAAYLGGIRLIDNMEVIA